MNSNQKEEFRYLYAGMAMQAMMTAALSEEKSAIAFVNATKESGDSSVKELIAKKAIMFADALIEALDKPNTDNQTTEERERFSDPYEECLHNKKGISL